MSKTEPEFYELIAFHLTKLGNKVFLNHGCWGYFEKGMPELEEYLEKRYNKFKGRMRVDKDQTLEEYNESFYKHELGSMQYPCLFGYTHRGFFKTVEDFEKPFITDGYVGYGEENEEIVVPVEVAASYVCGGYYERLMLVGRSYGLDHWGEKENRHFYEINRGEQVYKKVDEIKNFKGISF